MIACNDIAYAGAQALLHHDRYASREVGLCGDEKTWTEMNEVFQGIVKADSPSSYSFLVKGGLMIMNDFKRMFRGLNEQPADQKMSQKSREEFPDMLTFEEWLKTESAWKVKT